MGQRLKGSDTTMSMVSVIGTEDSFDTISSFEYAIGLELLSVGYLGEATERKDEILKGFSGNFSLHLANGLFNDFQKRVTDRAQRRTPAADQFNLQTRQSFPDGEGRRIQFPNIFFGEITVVNGSREDYVTGTVNWGCSDILYISS